VLTASTGSGPSLLVSDKSAIGVTVVEADALLLLIFESDVEEAMPAVLVMMPPALGEVTVMMTFDAALALRLPMVQVTTPLV
jgi:hypothetical protein